MLALLFSPVQAQEGDAPAAPTGLASEVSHDSVTLTWDDPQDDSITGYRILRRETDRQAPGVFTTINENTGRARTAYTDGTVEPETRYVYRVKAINAHGVSGQSNYADADTPAEPQPTSTPEASEPPAAPQNLISAAAHDHVVLSWDDPKDDSITGYRILRRETDRQAPGVFTTINRNTGLARTAYTDGTVEPETRYVYRVKAINAHGVSGQSNYADADTPAEPQPTSTPEASEPPAAPQNLISAAAHDHVVLSWDDPKDDSITGYRILRRETDRQAPGVFTTINENTGLAGTSYTDGTVEPETAYVYRVKAINAHGLSGQSNDARANTPAEPRTARQSDATDATLSSLTVSPGEIHGFASDRVEYHVGVASTVTQATITAEPTDPNATVAYTDADDNAIADADAADGHEVELSDGLNTVKVKVTAQDTLTTETYTVHVGRGVTAAYGWKAVDDFNTLIAAGNESPSRLWSDGETIWVVDSGYRDFGDEKLYAYDLRTRERAPDQDFDTLIAAGNQSPVGIWSDGETMWVGDIADLTKVFAYNLATQEPVPGEDFDTLETPNFEHDNPRGMWSDGATMWIADLFVNKVYAYDLVSKERVSGRDFNTLRAAGNARPSGLWSDGATMWVSDITADKVYSYNMPVSDNADLRTLTLDGEAVAGFDPSRTVYSLRLDEMVTQVTVAAEARQLLAEVTGITPDDADAVADGHLVAVSNGRGTVTVTVTAQDGTTKAYTVSFGGDQSCNESDPGSLTVGGQASGEISDRPGDGSRDCDWFRVELAGGKTYQFDLKGRPTGDGTLADPMIFGTYDSEGTAVAYDRNGNRLYKAGGTVTTDPNVAGAQPVHWDNRDGGVGWNARLFFFVPSGQGGAYYLNVIGESGPGSYVLTAAEALTDEIGDDAENAKFILSRDSRSDGVIETPEDVDWFQVRLVAGGVYNVEVLGKSWGEDGETLSRPCLAGIYDHNSNLIADTADDRGRLEFTAPTSTAYYVAVCQNARGSAELPPGSYTVRITGVSVPQSVSEPEGEDFSANASTAGFVVVGDRVRGKIESYSDADWFAVDLAAGIAYRFEMRGAGTEGNTLQKPRIFDIFDSTGMSLGAAAWTRPDDDDARADFTPTVTGRYYIATFALFELIPEDGDFGTYALSVDER